MRSSPFLIAALCLSLFACGGGGGGGSGGSSGDGNQPSTASRAVPGYQLGAKRLSAVQAGQPCTIHVNVTPEAGQPAVQELAGWLGDSVYTIPGSTIATTPVAGEPGVWQMVVTVPDPLPADATVWLRLTTADGAVMEVGRNAFELAALPGG